MNHRDDGISDEEQEERLKLMESQLVWCDDRIGETAGGQMLRLYTPDGRRKLVISWDKHNEAFVVQAFDNSSVPNRLSVTGLAVNSMRLEVKDA